MAEISQQELSAVGKIISLSNDVAGGAAEFAVVFDPSSAESVADKDKLQSLIGSAYKAPKHTFSFVAVPASDVANITAPVVFMTSGLSGDTQKQALANASSRKAVTISTDLSAVEAGNCVIGVDVGSSVRVIMNADAYNASGLSFDAAFEFMVKEI